jgi:hypothetical protein
MNNKEYSRDYDSLRHFGVFLSFISCFKLIGDEQQGYASEYKEKVNDLVLSGCV